jgi:hypothetical protein
MDAAVALDELHPHTREPPEGLGLGGVVRASIRVTFSPRLGDFVTRATPAGVSTCSVDRPKPMSR